MTPEEKNLAAAVVSLAKALCGEYYLGRHERTHDGRNAGYDPEVEENWFKWVPRAKLVLEQALPVNPENVTVLGWVLSSLAESAAAHLARVGGEMGKAGHAASEHLQVELHAVDLATQALVGVKLSPPDPKF